MTQYNLTAVDSDSVAEEFGSAVAKPGFSSKAGKLHTKLPGLHRLDRHDCITLIAEVKQIALPDSQPYTCAVFFSNSGVAALHSEQKVYTGYLKGEVQGFAPGQLTLPETESGIPLSHVKDWIESNPDNARFMGWGIYNLSLDPDNGGWHVISVTNQGGGAVIKEGKYTHNYLALIPWGLKTDNEKAKTLERALNYVSEELKPLVLEVASSDMDFQEALSVVGAEKKRMNEQSLRRLQEMDKQSTKKKTVSKPRAKKSESSTEVSDGLKLFLQETRG